MFRDRWKTGFFCDYANRGNHDAFSLSLLPLLMPGAWRFEPNIRRPEFVRFWNVSPLCLLMMAPLEMGLCGLTWVPEGPPGEVEVTVQVRTGWFGSHRGEEYSPAARVWPSDVFYVSPSVLKNNFFFFWLTFKSWKILHKILNFYIFFKRQLKFRQHHSQSWAAADSFT